MKTRATVIGISIIFLVGFISLSWGAENVSLLTCSTAGVYYPLGAGMARIWNKYVPNINATAEPSGCSVVNMKLMEQGQANTALAQNDAVYFATKGLKFFEGKIVTKPRGVLMLYDEVWHIATTKQSGIKTIMDLKGKRVSVSFPGSIGNMNAFFLLEAYGMTEKDIKPYQLSLSDGIQQLKDGNIDALIETGGAPPVAGFLDLAHTRDVVFIGIDKEHREKLIQRSPYLSHAVIPSNTYKGIDQDLPTLAVTCMLVASSDLGSDLVYKLTKAIFEHLDILGESHIKGKLVSLETSLRGMILPLHPGAEKYYKEVGKIK